MAVDKQLKSYIFTGTKSSCSGCGACVQICAKKALTMQPDEEGFLYPVMDTDKCVQCGLCNSRCPVIQDQSNDGTNQHAYIATTEDIQYYKESASIGICTMLADYVVEQGGVVYGCYLDEDKWTAYHIGVSDKDGVQRIRNSKYLQSDTRDTFLKVKQNLQDGKIVLYIGTPCQIAGLKSYLRKEYENLYTVDLICHGVFSPKLLPLEIQYWETLFNGKLSNFRFRSKRKFPRTNGGMVNFNITKTDGTKTYIERYAASSPSYHCYAYHGDGIGYNHRLSCYTCEFKSQKRYGDITVGDPWCIKADLLKDEQLSYRNVIRSLYSANTEQGQFLLDKIAPMLYMQEYPISNVFVQDALLQQVREIPPKRGVLFEQLNSKEYGSLIESLFDCKLEYSHTQFVRSYRKQQVKNIIKKLLFINRIKHIIK